MDECKDWGRGSKIRAMTEEWLVEVNDQDEVIGRVLRDEAHREQNLRLHREVMLLLFIDESHQKFVLQHRSMKKKQLPGLWTLSATGHVDYADISENDVEGYLTAAIREAEEEIGVIPAKLEFKGRFIQRISQNWSMMGVVIGQYSGEMKLDSEEVEEARVFDKSDIDDVFDKLTPGARACLKYLKLLTN